MLEEVLSYDQIILTGVQQFYTIHLIILLIFRELASFPAEQLPRNFDAREKWPLCSSIHNVPNQGGCGSCFVSNLFLCDFFNLASEISAITVAETAPEFFCNDYFRRVNDQPNLCMK